MKKYLILLPVAIYLVNALFLILEKPAVWPDEAIYHDIAHNIIHRGQIATDLWGGLKPGADIYAAWNPPVFFLTLAFWQRTLGDSIIHQRLLSVLFGALILILTFRLAQRLISPRKNLLLLLVPLGLALDFHFVRGSRLSRPEILTLFLLILALFLKTARPLRHHQSPRRLVWFLSNLSVGIIMGLAILTHPIALIFLPLIPVWDWLHQRSKIVSNTLIYLLGVTTPIFIWIYSVLPVWPLVWAQLNLAVSRKNLESAWIVEVFQHPNPWLQLIFISFVILSLIYIKHTIRHPQPTRIWLLSLLLTSWFASIFGRQLWYTIFVTPPLYLAATDLISSRHRFVPFDTLTLGLSGPFISNLIYSLILILSQLHSPSSYHQYTTAILHHIPDHTTVFLSAIPDPYFGFISANRSNTLYEFPDYSTSPSQYLDLLNSVDYIVFTGSQEQLLFGSLLTDYINSHAQEIIPVGQDTNYPVQIIKLKSSD